MAKHMSEWAEGKCEVCGKTVRRRRPADYAVCVGSSQQHEPVDVPLFPQVQCPECGRRMVPGRESNVFVCGNLKCSVIYAKAEYDKKAGWIFYKVYVDNILRKAKNESREGH